MCRKAGLLAWVLLAWLSGAADAPGRNLIRNGDFEGNLPGGGVDYWSPNPTYPVTAEVIEDPQQAHAGARFLRLAPATPDTEGCLYQFINRVQGAEEYRAELWARGPGASVRVFIYEYGPDLKFLGSQHSEPLNLSADWQLCRLQYRPRADLKNLACAVHVHRGPVDVDDIRVTASGADVPLATPVAEEPWQDNALGLSERVPAPFTPLEVEEGEAIVVRCWGRELHLRQAPLPTRLFSQGEDLLSRPMRLLLRFAGAEATPVATHWRVAEARGDVVNLQATSQAGSCRLTVSITEEFDGLTRVDLQLAPQAPEQVEQLWIEVPLRAEVARLMYHRLAGSGNYYGRAPAEREVWPFLPVVWVGNHRRGLCWFAEAPRGWRNASGDQRLEWLPGREEGVLRVRIIDLPTRLSEPATFTFGLLATPPKRPPGEAEDHFVRGGPCDPTHVKIIYPQVPYSGDVLGYHLSQEQREHTRKIVGSTKEGQRAAPWVQLCMLRPLPGYEQYLEQFRLVPGRSYPPDFVFVCPASAWAEMLLYGLAQLQADTGAAGFYFDTGTLTPCSNTAHGCGYREQDGTLTPSYPIFALHEFKKRLYRVLEERLGAERAFISSLINGHMDLPVLTFDSAAISGEELNSRVRGDYFGAISMEQVCLQYDAHTWGLWHQWLPAMTAEPDRDTTDSFLAFALPTHTPMWIAYTDYARVFEVLDALQAFGTREARFLPPWQCEGLVSGSAQGLCVAMHVREDAALLVVSNLQAQGQEAWVRVNWAAAGLGQAPAGYRDLLTGEDLPTKEGGVVVQLPPRGFRLVRAGP